jgi:hypothetical protein
MLRLRRSKEEEGGGGSVVVGCFGSSVPLFFDGRPLSPLVRTVVYNAKV